MEWYNIVSIIVGALGGVTGFISLYKAKAEKTSIEVENMKQMLDEAHKMYDTARGETENTKEEFRAYKEETMKYIAEFKERFTKVEKRLDMTEEEVFRLRGAIYQAYRCKFPPQTLDCPVIKQYEASHCAECIAEHETKEE